MSTTNTARPPRGSLVVLALLLGLWLCWSAWWLLAPEGNPGGQCEGLGFGCTLSPRSLAEFAAVIVLAPFSVLVVAVTGVVRMVRMGRGSRRTVWDLVLAGLLGAALLLWLLGTVGGAF